MKVQCGQCPAKYAVSDDRITGKKVRLRCKRCGAAIVVDGRRDPAIVTSSPAGTPVRASVQPSGPPELDAGRALPPSRPPAPTILGGLQAPRDSEPVPRDAPEAPAPSAQQESPAGKPAENRGFTDPPEGSDPNRWRVALTRQDLRWMTTTEVQEAYGAGAIRAETFVFLSGESSWVTLNSVAELANAVGVPVSTESRVEKGNADAPPSSRPPPRKPLSSRPPPRKSWASAEAPNGPTSTRPRASSADIAAKGGSASIASSLAASLDGATETDESLPFSLDAARASSRRPAVSPTADDADPNAKADEALFEAGPTQQAGAATDSAPLAPPEVPAGGGRNPWLMVLVALIVAAVVAGVLVAGKLGYLPYSP